MSMGHTRPSEARPPLLEILPDDRKRLTRFRTLTQGAKINDSLVQLWGTVDTAPTTAAEKTEGFANLRLVDQKSGEPGSVAGVDPKTPLWLEVYETLPATGEVQVGADTLIELEDGRSAIVRESLQLSADTFVSAGPAGSAITGGYLQKEEAKDDGALRRITRTIVESGTLEQDNQSLQGGKLLKRTIVSAVTVPATPSGYTLVGSPVQHPNGLPVYTYTFYKGDGEISRTYALSDAGATNVPLDAAAVGVNRVTILHLTANSVTDDPTTNPNAVCFRTSIQQESRDGHKLWTVVWVNGAIGSVVVDVTTKNGGKLVIYHGIGFGVVPAAPTATIGGTVSLIEDNTRKADGYVIYDRTWAEGEGEISRRTSTRNNGALSLIAVRHLTAPAAAIPISTPSGYTLVESEPIEADGHRIWSAEYAKGDGEISRRTSTRNNGALSLVVVRHLTAPAAGNPISTPSGYTLVESEPIEADGHRIWSAEFAQGEGLLRLRPQGVEAGLLRTVATVLTPPADVLADAIAIGGVPANGKLADYGMEELDGMRRWDLALLFAADGTAIVDEEVVVTFEKNEDFTYPGRAKYYSETVLMPPAASVTATCHDVYLSPPETAKVLATHSISYQDSAAVGTITPALWNPTSSATVKAEWTMNDGTNYNPRSKVEGLRGYRAVNAGGSGTTSGADFNSCIFGERMPSGANWSIELAGGPSNPDATAMTLHVEVVPAFYDLVAGVQWYRRTQITATPAAQAALPV